MGLDSLMEGEPGRGEAVGETVRGIGMLASAMKQIARDQ